MSRGRSPTTRRSSTNASSTIRSSHEHTNSNHDKRSNPWMVLKSLAFFGESTFALFVSFLLLVVAIGISIYLEESNDQKIHDSLLLKGQQEHCKHLSRGKPALQSGDLNRLFEKIVAQYDDYENINNTTSIQIHSRPTSKIQTDPQQNYLPWIVTVDDFLTIDECKTMIELGYQQGYQRSVDVGKQNLDSGQTYAKTTMRRTSETAWCTKPNCKDHDITISIQQRISKLLDIPTEYSEDFQILKYQVGQCKTINMFLHHLRFDTALI